jgi:photosystem II stability/assembly factor-like uncharacterized protein
MRDARTVYPLPIWALAAAIFLGACAPTSGPSTSDPAPRVRGAAAEATRRPATPLAERRAPEPANVAYDPALFEGLEWHWIGPARGGRVTAVTGVIGQPGSYYFGATGGGVWKTTDYGESWRNVSDRWFETPSIGAIRVAESDPNVVWVATGSDGLRSNVITGLGVYRSTDAGETWRFLGLRAIGATGAIEVDPRDPDVAYVAAIGQIFGPSPERGLYRTRDGGETWENVLFISDSTGIVDVEIDPRNPDVLYASSWRGERKPWTIISGAREGGVYKSTDGGDSWTVLGNGLPTGPGELFGKTDLAVSRSNPDVVYVLIEAPEPRDGLYRSDDGGRSWRQVSSLDALTARAFYYTNVDVDPTDPETVWVNAHVPLFRSTDGGASWERVPTPHGDNHDIWIDPSNPELMVQGNDGGANVSRDGGRTWSTQLNQPTAELYTVDLDDRFPYWAYAGQQDRSAVGVASRPPAVGDNELSLGCETGPAVPKPGDPDVVYNSCKGRFMVWDRETGQNRHYYVGAVSMYGHAARDLPYRMQRVTPITVSPHDPNRVYYGTQYVMVTEDGGVTWERLSDDLTATPPGTQGISGEPITRDITGEEVYSTLYAIAESPLRRGVIWVGSYDGPFHVSTDDGATWTDVTPPDLPPGGRVQSIDASPHDAGTAIYSVMRFMLDDWRPYVYRTTDYGRSWSLLTSGRNGIPADYPVRVVREDTQRPGLLYAGAEFGVYVSFDHGARWQPLQLDLPVVPVTDMAFRDDDLVISTMGRGFQVLRDLTPLRRIYDAAAAGPAHLHRPATATLATWRGDRPGPATPEYGQPGAVVDWILDPAPDNPITVELLALDGRVINGWTSDPRGYFMPPPVDMPGVHELRVPGPRVPSAGGHTRFTVPLEHPGPWAAGQDGPGTFSARGPVLAPGRYQVRVTAGEWSGTQPLTVVMDPRLASVGVTAGHLTEQEELGLAVRDLVSRARRALHTVEAALERAATGSAAGRVERDRLEALHAELTQRRDQSYPQGMLVEQIGYLYSMVTGTAQRPGRDAHQRYGELLAQLEHLEARL